MFGLKTLKYLLAVIIVLGVYSYLKKEGAFKKTNTTKSPSAFTLNAATNSDDDELVWPDLEEEKLTLTLDESVKAQKILEYLLHDKVADTQIRCEIKKAKKSTFIGCRNGTLVKDNYWELSTKAGKLQLFTRNETALYLAKKYNYKELVVDQSHISDTIEKAFEKFFDKK